MKKRKKILLARAQVLSSYLRKHCKTNLEAVIRSSLKKKDKEHPDVRSMDALDIELCNVIPKLTTRKETVFKANATGVAFQATRHKTAGRSSTQVQAVTTLHALQPESGHGGPGQEGLYDGNLQLH